ncbi:thioredoxin family protein [Candidatus Nomurabacteria bacterium]|nr:thioredoxin family protein [Candidatus Nomurabacteria bacterium]
MNKNTIVVAVVLAIIIIAGGIYALTNIKNDTVMSTDKVAREAEDEAMTKEQAMAEQKAMEEKEAMMKAGSYETYTQEKLALASATHDVVLFFRANWCPTCRAADADIKANLGNIPSSLSILDVNYDNSADLKKKYGVTYQHTFVQVDKDGNLIKKWSGSSTLAALVAEVK